MTVAELAKHIDDRLDAQDASRNELAATIGEIQKVAGETNERLVRVETIAETHIAHAEAEKATIKDRIDIVEKRQAAGVMGFLGLVVAWAWGKLTSL